AAGMKGLMVVKLWPEAMTVNTLQTAGFAQYVDVFDDKVFVSEGSGGFSIWKYKGHGQLVPMGKYCSKDMLSVRQGKIYASGRYAVLLCKNSFEVLEIEEPQNPKKAAEYSLEHTVYGDQMSEGCVDGRYACVFKHSFGMRWLDLGAEPQHMFTDVYFSKRCSLSSGIAALDDQFLVTFEGGYRLIAPMEENIESMDLISYGGDITGKPRIYGDYLFISDRISSRIEVVNIKDPQEPRLYDKLKTEGNPGAVSMYNNALVIPDGYNGLLIYDNYFK
ncbi:MAG: hypothetical protein PHG48_02315, partial [Eubacteriales bacterium]|nr:hypothetical protein [Eubacteriales bacterium]